MADQEPVEGYDPEQLDKKAAAVEEAVAVGLELAAASVASDIGQQFVAGPADAVTVPGVWAQIVEDRIAPLISDIIYDTAETIRLGIADAGERLYAGEAIVPTEVLDPRPIDNVTAEGLLSHATNRMNDIGNDLWLNIQQTLAEGVAQGDSIPELTERVRQAAPVTEPRARTVARTESQGASNGASIAQARSAGVSLNKTWLATLGDGRTRPAHLAAEGQTVPLDEPFMIGEPVAYPLDFPGDPSGPPELVINCRCTLGYQLLRTLPEPITISSVHLFTCREGNSKTGKVLHKGPCVGWKHGLPETDPRHPKNAPPKKARASKPRARKAPYLTQQQAQQMQDRMLEGDPWTEAQKHGLSEYIGNFFKPMNDVLRGLAAPEDREAYYGLPPGGLRRLIDDASAGMRPTTRPLSVTRALGWDAFGLGDVRLRDVAEAAHGLKGRTFEDRGFLSTTTKREPPLSTIGNAILKLEVPAGTRAAYVRSLSHRPEESELILGPGTAFKVTDVQRTPKGMVVSGRVMPRTAVPEVAAYVPECSGLPGIHLFTCTGDDGLPTHPGRCRKAVAGVVKKAAKVAKKTAAPRKAATKKAEPKQAVPKPSAAKGAKKAAAPKLDRATVARAFTPDNMAARQKALEDEYQGRTVGDLFAMSDRDRLKTAKGVLEGDYAGLRLSVTSAKKKKDENGTEYVQLLGKLQDSDGKEVGRIERLVIANPDGSFTAEHSFLSMEPEVQGQGAAEQINAKLFGWYRGSRVKDAKLKANIDVGPYAWARAGWDLETEEDAKKVSGWLRETADGYPDAAQSKAALALADRLDGETFGSDSYPSAYEVSQLGRSPGQGKNDKWIGKDALLGRNGTHEYGAVMSFEYA